MSPKNCLHKGYLINHPVLCLETQPFQLDNRYSTKRSSATNSVMHFPYFLEESELQPNTKK